MSLKQEVYEFWNEASCGEKLYLHGADAKQAFAAQMAVRYQLEPYILPFAGFEDVKGKEVLEIGVGLGADHQMFAQNGARLSGCDITERAVKNTRKRLEILGLQSDLSVADAEQLPYDDERFDLVYSWGVIHHSPDTEKAISEIHRVLKPGGKAAVMIYYKYSIVGFMLWLRYGVLKLKPFVGLKEIYSRYLESPGTKAYTKKEARGLFKIFNKVSVRTVLTHGDLLASDAGQRHKGRLLSIAKAIYPRSVIKALFPGNGLFMLIDAEK